MTPTLQPGDRLLVVRGRRPRVGDLVCLRDPDGSSRLLVKRVVAVLPTGIEVRGDNEAASRDSRRFGPVEPSRLTGRARYRYFPPPGSDCFGNRVPAAVRSLGMALHQKDIDRLLEPELTSNLEAVPVDELRTAPGHVSSARRSPCPMFGDCSKVSSTSWRRNWRREAEVSAATRVVSSRTCPRS